MPASENFVVGKDIRVDPPSGANATNVKAKQPPRSAEIKCKPPLAGLIPAPAEARRVGIDIADIN